MGNGYNNNNAFWLRTGIGVKKFVHPYDTHENRDMGRIRRKAEPAIRYAEILLIYAEALNELDGSHNIESWDGSKTYTIKRDINEMKKVFVLSVAVLVFRTIQLPNMQVKICSGKKLNGNV